MGAELILPLFIINLFVEAVGLNGRSKHCPLRPLSPLRPLPPKTIP